MGLGKINTFIDIILVERIKDDEGFSKVNDNILATIRAYKEERHGNETWKNRASFSQATTMFQFRKLPNISITTEHFIVCKGTKYNIVSVEDIRDKGMYMEVLAEKIIGSKG